MRCGVLIANLIATNLKKVERILEIQSTFFPTKAARSIS